ncbi:hypothetical protein Agabi119p4_1446 [Agaricus bisporus var. burnettii]|uniref:Uncharacterized protein n=1 Tax=Agaricus bisporus var. burnettii TaxID=192524 RepID=A0A8H7F9U2_AGABI|nr:hypothetical protein Agabi119p4_1446 [Agaricus bisporus var. burnettii]
MGEISYPGSLCMGVASSPSYDAGNAKLGQQVYYLDKDSTSTPVLFCFMGEITSSGFGTSTTAIGNFRPSGYNPVIKDGTSVKDIFCLQSVTDSPPSLSAAFETQLGTVTEIIAGESELVADGFQELYEPMTACIHGTTLDTMKFTSGLKYSIPRRSTQSTAVDKPSPPKKIKLSSVAEQSEITNKPSSSNNVLTNDNRIKSDQSSLKIVNVGEYYDPKVLDDYKGDLFQHDKSQLVQQPYYDEEDKLIPPWDVQSKLRKGTVVFIDAYLHCWLIPKDTVTCKKVYQLSIEKLRVVSPSDDEVHKSLDIHMSPQSTAPRREQPKVVKRGSDRINFSGFNIKAYEDANMSQVPAASAASSPPSTRSREKAKAGSMRTD